MALYKYASFNDVFTQKNLKNHILYFNTPNKFNDPFDIYSIYEMGDSKNFYKNFVQLMDNQNVNITNISDKHILDLMTIKTRSDRQSSQYGITCFSKDNDNIVMWSNYADKHRGICLEFNDKFLDNKLYTKNVSSGVKVEIIPIKYVENREKFSMELLAKGELPKNTKEFLSSKYKAWSYEKEVRIMAFGPLFCFPRKLYYKSECLTRIVLGAMMPIDDYLKFYKLKKESLNEIPVSISTLHENNYKLIIVPFSINERRILYKNMKYLMENIAYFKRNAYVQFIVKKYGQDIAKKYLPQSIGLINLHTVISYFRMFTKSDYLVNAIEDNNKFLLSSKFMTMLQYQVDYLAKMNELREIYN